MFFPGPHGRCNKFLFSGRLDARRVLSLPCSSLGTQANRCSASVILFTTSERTADCLTFCLLTSLISVLRCGPTVTYLEFLVCLLLFSMARVFNVVQDEDYANYTGQQFLDERDFYLWSELPFFADVLKVDFYLFHPYFKFDSFTSRTLVYGSEDTDTLLDLHRCWSAIQTQIQEERNYLMWRFLVDSNIHEHNCLRKLRKILLICNHLIKVTRKAEVLPSPPDQEVQFTALI